MMKCLCNEATQEGAQFKTYKLFLSGILYLIFSDYSRLQDRKLQIRGTICTFLNSCVNFRENLPIRFYFLILLHYCIVNVCLLILHFLYSCFVNIHCLDWKTKRMCICKVFSANICIFVACVVSKHVKNLICDRKIDVKTSNFTFCYYNLCFSVCSVHFTNFFVILLCFAQ